jgi:hypothetical protein
LDVGALTLNAGSILDFELGAPGVSDVLNVNGLLTLNGGSINLADAGGLGAGTYTLVNYNSLSGSVANLGTPTGPAGFSYQLIDTGSMINLAVTVPGVAGDYNNDGSVDAGDYVVWRMNQGTTNPLPNDNNIGGTIGQAHYDLWRAHFGETVGSGSQIGSGAPVPEPALAVLLAFALAPLLLRGRQTLLR